MAVAASLRQIRRLADQSALDRAGPDPATALHHRRRHVVESRAPSPPSESKRRRVGSERSESRRLFSPNVNLRAWVKQGRTVIAWAPIHLTWSEPMKVSSITILPLVAAALLGAAVAAQQP